MKRVNNRILIALILAVVTGFSACSRKDKRQPAKPEQHETSTPAPGTVTTGKPALTGLSEKEMEDLRQTFQAYMQACVKKDVNAMANLYDLEHIAMKWGDRVGNDTEKIRQMIKGIVANKPDEFYRMCAVAKMESVKVIETPAPDAGVESRVVEVTCGDWSWTFRQSPTGWKLIEEGVSGPTLESVSGGKDQ